MVCDCCLSLLSHTIRRTNALFEHARAKLGLKVGSEQIVIAQWSRSASQAHASDCESLHYRARVQHNSVADESAKFCGVRLVLSSCTVL